MIFGPLPLDAKDWKPHGYQLRAVDFLTSRSATALWAEPGLGKTTMVLEAFRQLKEKGAARRMLVIAPLLPATEVWPYEVRKWKQFRHFKIAVLHGASKMKMLRTVAQEADITITNYESLVWLLNAAPYMPDYDIVVYDESTKIKTPGAQRSRAARKLFRDTPYRWQLTGTPAPNGYEDVFGQILALDGGAALGRTMGAFRSRYYTPNTFQPYKWDLLPGAMERIESRIAPMVFRLAAADYIELPKCIDDVRSLHMPPAIEKQYKSLKRDMLLALPEGMITAANAAAVYSKLEQLANGAIYTGEDKKYATIHDIKLDALEELREELGDTQLFVAYRFQSDIARIRKRFGDVVVLSSKMPKSKRAEIISAWNAGNLKTLYGHPASIGLGLNLQGSNAHHICWFSATWNLEHYKQTIARLVRQGNDAASVINHILTMVGTIDELKIAALCDKDAAQDRLLQALKLVTGVEERNDSMAIRKLGDSRAQNPVESAPVQEEDREAPSWGPKRKATSAAAVDRTDEPREEFESGSPGHRAEIRRLASGGGALGSAPAEGVKAALRESLGYTASGDTPPAGRVKKAEKAAEVAQKPAKEPVKEKETAQKTIASGGHPLTPKDRLDAIVEMFRSAVEAALKV